MAKRSRKARKLATAKTNRPTAQPILTQIDLPTKVATINETKLSVINFAEEYYYVYTDLSTIAIIAFVMLFVMFGLSIVI